MKKKMTDIETEEELSALIWYEDTVNKGKLGRHYGEVLLTPALATLLIERNEGNRVVSKATVERYSREIKNNTWSMNGEGIKLSVEGFLNDGQHRCLAVIKTGISALVAFAAGLARESRNTLDQGKKRDSSDILSMNGYEDTNNLSSVLNYAIQYKKYNCISTHTHFRPAAQEKLDFVLENDSIVSSLNSVPSKNSNLYGGRAILAFCHWAIARRASVREADEFISLFVSGGGFALDDTILYIRNRLLIEKSRKHDPHTKIFLILRAWNAYRRNDKIPKVIVKPDYLPEIEK